MAKQQTLRSKPGAERGRCVDRDVWRKLAYDLPHWNQAVNLDMQNNQAWSVLYDALEKEDNT